MLFEFQNEIIATISILTLIFISLFLKRTRQSTLSKEEPTITLPQQYYKPVIQKEEINKKDTLNFEKIQDESLLGSQEGNFETKTTNIENKKNSKKITIKKRNLIQHGKITKQNFSEFSGSRILVAEDNIINQKVITGLLAGSGIEVILANNGQEALNILEKDSDFMMILMDAHMPIMDGMQATKIIRQNEKYNHIVIVALSGDTAQDDIKKMKNIGMDETLGKPLKIDSFYDLIYMYYCDKNKEDYITVVMTHALNGNKGLEVCGGDELFYREILQEFLQNYANSAQRLKILLHDDKKKDADRLLLDIIGITANIGAQNANIIASELKISLLNTDIQEFTVLIEKYHTHLNILIKDIEEYIS